MNGRGDWGVGSRCWGWCCWRCSLATVDRWGSDAEAVWPWARSVVSQPLPSSDERGGLVAGFRPAFTWGGGRENGVSGFWGFLGLLRCLAVFEGFWKFMGVFRSFLQFLEVFEGF